MHENHPSYQKTGAKVNYRFLIRMKLNTVSPTTGHISLFQQSQDPVGVWSHPGINEELRVRVCRVEHSQVPW